jgi:hypothetical protein
MTARFSWNQRNTRGHRPRLQQNASHNRVFQQPASSLKASSSEDRVLIEVEDECGGLLPGDSEDLFRSLESSEAPIDPAWAWV